MYTIKQLEKKNFVEIKEIFFLVKNREIVVSEDIYIFLYNKMFPNLR